MIKNNLLGQILIGTLVIFLLISSVQMFGLGQGIDKIKVSKDNGTDMPVVPKLQQSLEDPTMDTKYLVGNIIDHPMFSTTRKPFIEPETTEEQSTVEIVINELKAQLTGVVITPEQSYAMILDTITNQRETYKIGMPLAGEQGGWALNSIETRKVTFTSDDNKTQELELEVFSGKLKSTKESKPKKDKSKKDKKTASQAGNTKKATNTDKAKKDKKKTADDIRKKIAERRAQMRADTAKNR